MSPFLAQTGHVEPSSRCPLSGVKRTLSSDGVMSAYDPKRTWRGLKSRSAASPLLINCAAQDEQDRRSGAVGWSLSTMATDGREFQRMDSTNFNDSTLVVSNLHLTAELYHSVRRYAEKFRRRQRVAMHSLEQLAPDCDQTRLSLRHNRYSADEERRIHHVELEALRAAP